MTNSVPADSSYTYAHPNWLLRYPHLKRNKLVAKEIVATAANEWCDYGAGDGALLHVLERAKCLPSTIVLYEPEEEMHSQLIQNIGHLEKSSANLTFTRSLSAVSGTFSLITALEVLEHLPLPERIKFYQFLATRLRDSGVVLLELPIEYGPILLAKEWGRKFLKGRSSQYGTGELLAAAFLGKISDRHARYEASDDRTFISPHHGFDINRLIRELKSIGTPKEILRSPFAGLPRWLNQTVLFSFQLTERSPSKIEAAVLAAN